MQIRSLPKMEVQSMDRNPTSLEQRGVDNVKYNVDL